MSRTEIGASVNVEFKSIGEMRKAIKDATSQLVQMQQQFGESSPQAQELARRIGEMRDQIADANEQINNFSPGNKFKAVTDMAALLASGFTAVQGAMNLVGIESESLEKQLVKIQSLMALSEGLSQLGEAGEAFSRFKDVAINTFRAIRAAIGSTGIGLLVIALGTIVAYWDDIKEAVSGVSAEQKKLNEDSAKNLKTQQDKLDALGLQENSLKLQGKSEREILDLKIKATDEVIKATEAQIEQNKITLKAQIEASQRNKDILQGILTFISAPIAALLKGIDLIGDAVGKNFDLYEKFYGGISSFVFDPKAVEEEGKKALDEQDKALKQLQSQRDGYEIQRREIDKANAKKANDEKIAFEKEFTKFLEEENARRLKIGQDSFDQERTAIDNKYKDLIAKAKKYGLDTSEIEGLRFQETKDLVNKTTIENQIGLDKQLSNFTAMVPKMATATTKITKNEQTEANTRKGIAEDEANNRIALAQAVGQTLGALTDIVGRETAAGKAIGIAQATINTFLGITEVWKSKAVLPEPFNTASKIAATITTAASGFAAVRGIVRTQVPGASSGGGSSALSAGGVAPLMAQASPAVTAQALNSQAINNLGNQGMRAYVLNSDIQNTEQRNAYINRSSSVGGATP
jgi:hypothetical protein